MEEIRNKFLRIGVLVTLYIGWVTFYEIYLISSQLGLMDDPSFIRTGIIGFLVLLILLSLFTLSLYVLREIKSFQFLGRIITKIPGIRFLIFVVPGLIFFLLVVLILLHPFSESFGAFRLFTFLSWSVLFSLLISLGINLRKTFDRVRTYLSEKKALWILLIIFFITITTIIFLSPKNPFFQDILQRLILFAIVSLLSADCLSFVFPSKPWWSLWAFASLSLSIVLLISQEATLVTPYPFTLAWSEGKWMLDGSLILANKVYGFHSPIPFQEPTQAIFRAFPYLFSNTPSLLFQRAWGFVLSTGIPILTAVVFTRKFKSLNLFQKLLLGLLFLCLLSLGPIKFYLLIIFLVFMLLYNSKSNLRISLAVVASSLIVPPTRLNWYLVPGALVLFFHILETPYRGNLFKYLWKPVVFILLNAFVVGSIATLFFLFSGNSITVFSVLSSSPFLWGRLFFFPSSPLGLLVPAILLSAPSIWLIAIWMKRNRSSFHWVRSILVWLMLLLFFLGGLVISAKIGGGNNLHNLDIFFILLAVVSIYSVTNSIQTDPAQIYQNPRFPSYAILASAILFSLWLLYSLPGSTKLPNLQKSFDNVKTLQSKINQIKSTNSNPALFIYQTQLLASGLIQDIKPVANYDNVFLIEMAISNYQPVLEKFYDQLEAHTWSVIVMPPLYAKIKDISTGFAEENNAWVEKIIFPMLCSYQSVYVDKVYDYELLVPRGINHQCP